MKRLFKAISLVAISLTLSVNAFASSSDDYIDHSFKEPPAATIVNDSSDLLTSGPVPGDGINESYTLPTKEQIAEEARLAEEYVNSKRIERGAGGSKTNAVGEMKQQQTWSCGPAAARNAINEYLWYNYTRLGLPCTLPTEETLIGELAANAGGTGFDATRWQNTMNKYAPNRGYTLTWGTASGWKNGMSTRVITTIDLSANYNVIGDLYHSATSTPIHPVYANGAAHYICIYGYNDSSQIYCISDSKADILTLYATPYENAANSTKARGIIW